MQPLTPRQIVAELDQHIVGQTEAKRSVAIAVRNRWRRQQLSEEMGAEVSPKNILMIGPTGVGKTEIARRFSKLSSAPFIKVEATKYTEVGYYGRDIESMVRDLVESAIVLVRGEEMDRVRDEAKKKVEDRLLELLHPRSEIRKKAKKERLRKGADWKKDAKSEKQTGRDEWKADASGLEKLRQSLEAQCSPEDLEFAKLMQEEMMQKAENGEIKNFNDVMQEMEKLVKHREKNRETPADTRKNKGKLDEILQRLIGKIEDQPSRNEFTFLPEELPGEMREVLDKLAKTVDGDGEFTGMRVCVARGDGSDEDFDDDDVEEFNGDDDFDDDDNDDDDPAASERKILTAEYEKEHENLRQQLREGRLDDRMVTVPMERKQKSPFMMMNITGNDNVDGEMADMFERFMPRQTVIQEMTVAEAGAVLLEKESGAMVSEEKVHARAVELAENSGIIFIDEIDKIVAAEQSRNADVSRQGVQRDLLPLVEGTTVQTRYGHVKTDYILFIAAGAFHRNKPSDLMPELQGRFPIRVELDDLTQEDFERILKEPKNSLLKQYEALLKTEGVEVVFEEDAIRELAACAWRANQTSQNIGARRLYTIMERLLEELSFEAADMGTARVVINAGFVRQRLEEVLKDEDLARYIL